MALHDLLCAPYLTSAKLQVYLSTAKQIKVSFSSLTHISIFSSLLRKIFSRGSLLPPFFTHLRSVCKGGHKTQQYHQEYPQLYYLSLYFRIRQTSSPSATSISSFVRMEKVNLVCLCLFILWERLPYNLQ